MTSLFTKINFILVVLFVLTACYIFIAYNHLSMAMENNANLEKLSDSAIWFENAKREDYLHKEVTLSMHNRSRTKDTMFEDYLHKEVILSMQNKSRTKYLVYECTAARGHHCSGWSDRIAGIMTTFIISILSKRKFLINFNTPCLLQDYVMPAHYDWRYNASILRDKTSSYHNFRNFYYTKIEKYMVDFNTYFNDDVTFVLFNWDFILQLRRRPNISYNIPWITQYHQADIYKHVYNFLFKLSPMSVRAYKYYIAQRTRNKIACSHVRRGSNPNMPVDGPGKKKLNLNAMWDFFDSLNMDEYDVFVASDTNIVKKLAKHRYPGNVIDTQGKITHIDKPHLNDPTEGFLKQLLDFHILTECDILIIPPDSGFSKLAVFVRDRIDGLYCWQENGDIIPCSRYTMMDIFPDGKFGEKKHGKFGEEKH